MCQGVTKKQLNPAIMNYLKSTTFKYYPCLPGEVEFEQWNLCIVSRIYVYHAKMILLSFRGNYMTFQIIWVEYPSS